MFGKKRNSKKSNLYSSRTSIRVHPLHLKLAKFFDINVSYETRQVILDIAKNHYPNIHHLREIAICVMDHAEILKHYRSQPHEFIQITEEFISLVEKGIPKKPFSFSIEITPLSG